jgi:hypothetical protein
MGDKWPLPIAQGAHQGLSDNLQYGFTRAIDVIGKRWRKVGHCRRSNSALFML